MRQPGNRDQLFWLKAKNDASGELNRFGKDLQKVDDIAARTRKSMALFAASIVSHRIGQGMTRFGQMILGQAKAAFDMASSFDKGQRLIRTQLDMTDVQYRNMGNSVINLSKRIPLPMEQIQEGLYDILSSMDVTTKQGITLTQQFAKAAVAGNVDIRSTTRAAIGALNAYSLPVSKATDVLDTQFQLVRKGVGTYEEFIGILGDVYPSAVASGQSLNDVSAALAFTTRNGLNASKAGISVARALDMLTRPQYAKAIPQVLGVDVIDPITGDYRRLTDIISDMGRELQTMSLPERKEALAQIFGAGEIRANRFFNIATSKFEDLRSMTQAFANKDVKGAMGSAFNIMSGAVGNRLEQIKNHFKAIVTVLARSFFPAIRQFFNIIDRLLDAFERLPDGVQKFMAQLILLTGVFSLLGGRVLTFMANLMGAQSMMLLAETTTGELLAVMGATALKVLKVAAVIGILVGALAFLIAHWDDVKRDFLEMGTATDWAIAAFSVLASVAIMGQLVPALITAAKWVRMFVILLAFRVTEAASAAGVSIGALTGAMVLNAAVYATVAAGVYMVVKAFQAWKSAQAAARESQEATNELNETWLNQVKTGVITFNEGANNIKRSIDDMGVAWETFNTRTPAGMINFLLYQNEMEERWNANRDSVYQNLHALNQWRMAGGKVVDAQDSTVKAVEKQIKVNKKLHQSTDWLEKKVVTFAGMTMEEIAKWKEEVSNNVNLVSGAIEDLGDSADLTSDKVLGSFRKQITAARNFFKNLRTLADRGLGEFAARTLIEMGPQGQLWAQAFVEGPRENIQQFNKLLGTATGMTETYAQRGIKIYEQANGAARNHFVTSMIRYTTTTEESLRAAVGVVDGYVGALKKIPTRMKTQVEIDLEEAKHTIDAWAQSLRRTNITIPVHTTRQPKIHSGGMIYGSGREVPAILETGEFVIRKEAVRMFGPLVQAVNNRDRKAVMMLSGVSARYHDGGYAQPIKVDVPTYQSPGSSSTTNLKVEQHFHGDGYVDPEKAMVELDWFARTHPLVRR